jgi:hypothetical protein
VKQLNHNEYLILKFPILFLLGSVAKEVECGITLLKNSSYSMIPHFSLPFPFPFPSWSLEEDHQLGRSGQELPRPFPLFWSYQIIHKTIQSPWSNAAATTT